MNISINLNDNHVCKQTLNKLYIEKLLMSDIQLISLHKEHNLNIYSKIIHQFQY